MNPKRNIPLGIIIALVVCCVFYVSSSSVLSLMIPYYMSDIGNFQSNFLFIIIYKPFLNKVRYDRINTHPP
jgi:amino acid transporter